MINYSEVAAFSTSCWIYNQPPLNWLYEDIWKLKWTSWENSIWSSKYFCHHYWYWQRCHVFRTLTLFLYQSCQSFSIEKHLISKSQTAVSWKVKRRPLYLAGRKFDWYWWQSSDFHRNHVHPSDNQLWVIQRTFFYFLFLIFEVCLRLQLVGKPNYTTIQPELTIIQ